MTDYPTYRLSPGQTDAHVRQMLREMASRLEKRRPEATFTAVGRIALIQAQTMTPSYAAALRAKCPLVYAPTTRAAYAVLLREIAGAR
ncbi:hypothetical protein [Streptomyces sp. NPDC002692]